MALVLSERDYKLLTILTKVGGIFTFAAGTLPSGLYVIRVVGEYFTTTKPVTLLK